MPQPTLSLSANVRSRRQKHRMRASIAAAAAILLGVLAFAPAAAAADALCPTSSSTDSCGEIRVFSTSTNNVSIATNYHSDGTVSGVIGYVAPGGSSNKYKTSTGMYRDWDAVWVPAGYRMVLYTGLGNLVPSVDNRVGKPTGVWHKVDNWGATVAVKPGSCP